MIRRHRRVRWHWKEVLRRKRDLSDTILSQAEAPAASGLTQDDLFALFKLAPPRSAAPIRAA